MAKKMAWLLVLGFVLVYLCPIGFRPMIVPDEVRYAEIPREMIASGDWIVPRLDGLDYFEKPAMGYWLIAISMLTFGQNAFAARFPSAMAAGLSALVVLWLMRRRTATTTPAFLAALILLTCFEVAGTGVFNVLDGMLGFFLTAAMAAFFVAAESPRGGARERRFLALFGAACGMAFLVKGFLAFAVPVVIVVPYMVWAGRWKDLFPMAVIPLAVAAVLALPWAVAVHLKAPDYWNYFFWQEHVKRFLAENAQHKAPFWLYFAAFPVAALPWSALIPAAGAATDRRLRQTSLFRYALCWILFPLLFFSAASGKLLTYILPCFPPFAMLLALGLCDGFEKMRLRAADIGIKVLVVLFSAILLALLIIQTTGIGGFIPYTHPWKAVVAGAGVAALIVCLGAALKPADGTRKVVWLAAGTMLFLFTSQWVLPDDTIEHKAPGALLARNADRVTADTVLVSLEDPLRATCWYYRRSDVFILGSPGELAYGLAAAGGRRRLDAAQFKDRGDQRRAGGVVLVGKAKHYRRWKPKLPPPVYEDTSGPGGYVFAQY